MRAVRISLVLLVLMAAVMTLSVCMNRHVCGTIKGMLQALPEQAAEVKATDAAALEEFWRAWRGWMRPVMNTNLWRSVNDLLGDVVLYGRMGDQAAVEYAAARHRLFTAIDEMSRPERAAP